MRLESFHQTRCPGEGSASGSELEGLQHLLEPGDGCRLQTALDRRGCPGFTIGDRMDTITEIKRRSRRQSGHGGVPGSSPGGSREFEAGTESESGKGLFN